MVSYSIFIQNECMENWTRIRTWVWGTASLCLVVFIGVIDYLTGAEIAFSPFYLIPTALLAWSTGIFGAVFGSFACALIGLAGAMLLSERELFETVLWWNTTARLINYLVVGILVARLKSQLDRQTELAFTDSKTSALNARAFRKLLNTEITRSRRFRHSFSVVFFDLDNFKMLNDKFGHAAGDTALYRIVQVCKRVIRQTDEVGRMGGDEFALLFPETAAEEAQEILQRLNLELKAEMASAGWSITFSMGLITVTDVNLSSVDQILEQADRLQYEAKKSGKNAVCARTLPPASPQLNDRP